MHVCTTVLYYYQIVKYHTLCMRVITFSHIYIQFIYTLVECVEVFQKKPLENYKSLENTEQNSIFKGHFCTVTVTVLNVKIKKVSKIQSFL